MTWVVDPIDGTTCFVSSLPSWCMSIACIDEQGHPFLGVVRDPTGTETVSTLDGHGVTINGQRVSFTAKGITDRPVDVGHPLNSPAQPTLSFLRGLVPAGGLFHNSGSVALALAKQKCAEFTDSEVTENHTDVESDENTDFERLHIPADTRPKMMAWYLERRL